MTWFGNLKHRAAALLNVRSRLLSAEDLIRDCEILASPRGEASAAATANRVLAHYFLLPDDQKKLFLAALPKCFGPDKARLEAAIDKYRQNRDAHSIAELHAASEPRLQQLIRRLNLANDGTAALVRMRQDIFRFAHDIPDFHALDADFVHLFSSWFNAGFLALRSIAWSSPGNILRKVIDYEAVHPIGDWDELRSRIEPPDRRCYAFFHPRMPDEPLIFVEVALTASMPETIQTLLAPHRTPIQAASANRAVFYSISNCQEGLRGVPFGNNLIKRTVETLRRELPGLQTFITLSPVPGLAAWLAHERARKDGLLTPAERKTLDALDKPDWHLRTDRQAELKEVMIALTARYIVQARSKTGGVIDPVARFHLGNGARLEQICFLADITPKGLRTGHAMMVSYLYDLRYIERNHGSFSERNQVPASATMIRLAKPPAGLHLENRHQDAVQSGAAPAQR